MAVAASVGMVRGEVTAISPREYFDVVQREINRAQTSISLYLYLFSFRPNDSQSPVFQLAQALRRARERGVRVEVVLDQNLDFVGEEDASVESKNGAAYRFLAQSGIPVFFDDPLSPLHAKVLMVDDETVVLGSSNCSRAAFQENQEANVLIRSTDVAREFLKTFSALPRRKLREDGPTVPLPAGFLLNPAKLGRMVGRADERAIDVYLDLMGKNAETVVLDYDSLAVSLGIHSMGREGYRRPINKTLDKLQKCYGLISV